jgi:hypothetical protein
VLEVVKATATSIKGGGKSLLTTGVVNIGAQVNVVRESPTSVAFSLTSGKRLIELCTFSAEATTNGAGGTAVRLGGLETYKTQQRKALGFVPVGPKQILGMDPYKRFLNAAADALRAADPMAELIVQQPADA